MNLAQAVALCVELEPIVAVHGGHVSLTGGSLYKDGERKDADIVIYRHKFAIPVAWEKLLSDIEVCTDLFLIKDCGRVKKFRRKSGAYVDIIDPNNGEGDYTNG